MNAVPDIQFVKKKIAFDGQLLLRWPTFLACLDLESLYTQLPERPFHQICLKTLLEGDRDQVIHLFDRLFAENLCLIKDLPEINPSLLQQKPDSRFLFSFSSLHDLILYLGWERMCISVQGLFDEQSSDGNFLRNLVVMKECLIESYLHIAQDGKTRPSLYRLLEALFFYHMREENLQKHTEEEWKILNQSFPVLKDQSSLADIFYIDDVSSSDVVYLTSEPQEVSNTRMAFANCLLKKELPHLDLKEKTIISIN